MFKWLTKEDFSEYAQMTVNIEDRFISLAVSNAYDFDVVPVLSDGLMTAIKSVLETNPIQWNRNATYSLNDIIFYDGIYYKTLIANTDSLPTSANTNWKVVSIMSFWTDYVKPYFVLSAYARFLLWHGANITQFGVRQNNEDTSIEISDKRRGELLADIKSRMNIYLSKLTKEFGNVKQTFDGTKYTVDSDDNTTPTRGGAQIWGVGYPNKKRVKCPNEYPYGLD